MSCGHVRNEASPHRLPVRCLRRSSRPSPQMTGAQDARLPGRKMPSHEGGVTKGTRMSGGEDDSSAGPNAGGNRTVFRPSPLAGLQTQFSPSAPAAPPPPAPEPEPAATSEPAASAAEVAPVPAPAPAPVAAPVAAAPIPQVPAAAPPPRPTGPRLTDEGFPVPSTPRESRAPLATEAGPVLALAASVRSGRARIAMADFSAPPATRCSPTTARSRRCIPTKPAGPRARCSPRRSTTSPPICPTSTVPPGGPARR